MTKVRNEICAKEQRNSGKAQHVRGRAGVVWLCLGASSVMPELAPREMGVGGSLGQPRSRQPPQRDLCAIRMCMMRAHACGLVVLDSTLPALAWTLDSRSLRARSERERRLEQ